MPVTETSITRRYIKLTLYVVSAALILMRRVVLLATKPGLTLSKPTVLTSLNQA